MDFENNLALLALTYTKGLGIKTIDLIWQHVPNLADALNPEKQSFLRSIPGIGTKTASYFLKSKNQIDKAKYELDFIKKQGWHLCTLKDDHYPELLKHIDKAPLFFFYKGNLAPYSKSISVVGTRNMTAYGKAYTKEIIKELSGYKPSIISGLALGVDTTAHHSALENNLPTVAVLGHGIHMLYPKENEVLARKILEAQGLLITEYSSFQGISPNHFLERNRIIAGLSQATIVIESGDRGGALNTARMAFENNREVWALPGDANSATSLGCHLLIKRNIAQIYIDVPDIVEVLSWETHSKSADNEMELKKKAQYIDNEKILKKNQSISEQKEDFDFSQWTKEEQMVYHQLNKKGKLHIDHLCVLVDLPMDLVVNALFFLELKNVAAPYAGGIYGLKPP